MSFVGLKQLVTDMLPRTSMLRAMILSEPDRVPKQEGIIKLTIYVKMFHQEIVSRVRAMYPQPLQYVPPPPANSVLVIEPPETVKPEERADAMLKETYGRYVRLRCDVGLFNPEKLIDWMVKTRRNFSDCTFQEKDDVWHFFGSLDDGSGFQFCIFSQDMAMSVEAGLKVFRNVSVSD